MAIHPWPALVPAFLVAASAAVFLQVADHPAPGQASIHVVRPAAPAARAGGFLAPALGFEPAAGDDRRFVASGPGYAISLHAGGADFRLRRPGEGALPEQVRMGVVGANPAARPGAEALQAARSHYLAGQDPAQWRTDVPRYGRVRYADIRPGVDLVYYGDREGRLEYDFEVAPGADPSAIRVAFDGVRDLSLDAAGNLRLRTARGELLQHAPVVYQEIDGERRPVEGRYLLDGDEVAFALGDYDRSRMLVIDPVITYSTYLGGSGADQANGVAVDGAGYFYVSGETSSIDFPGAGSTPDDIYGSDLFVSRYAPDGSLVYAAYLAGSGPEWEGRLAADDAGNAYVVGVTDSADYPVANPIQAGPTYAGGRAVVVSKLGPQGQLLFSTYLGGSADYGYGIDVDGNGHAWVTGAATYDFPVTPGAYQTTTTWGDDSFLARIDTVSGQLVFSTYIGAQYASSSAQDVAIDAAGNAWVLGHVHGDDFPVPGGFQGEERGMGDAYVAKVSADGSTLLYATYLGGTSGEEPRDIAVDGTGAAYVTGRTQSLDFPVANAFQPQHGGGDWDNFVAKITPEGLLAWSTYLGGSKSELYSSNDYMGIDVDAAGSAYVSGQTFSTNFPVVDPIQPTLVGSGAGTVTKFAPDGRSLAWSTYLGGEQYSYVRANAIAVTPAGTAYVAGITDASEFPIVDGAQPVLTDNYWDAFVARIGASGGGTPVDPARPRNDIDGDGRDDVVWRNGVTGADAIWLGADATRPRAMTAVRNTDWEIVGMGDFNGAGGADLFWRNRATGANTIWLDARSSTTVTVARVTNLAWRVAGVGDFDGDGRSDVLWRNANSGANVIWRDGNHARQLAVRAVAVSWQVAGTGDYDGDGRSDILWRQASRGSNVIWRGASDSAQMAVTGVRNLDWEVAGSGDYTGDGKADIHWRNRATGANVIWKGANAATQQAMVRITDLAWQAVGHGDYDGDGKADVLWRNARTGGNVVWRAGNYATPLSMSSVTNTDWRVVP
jgi:hypothetical protein